MDTAQAALFGLTGKAAIVTGSTRGIGFAIAEEMAKAGASLVVSSEDPQAVQAATQRLQGQGLIALGAPCDVTDDTALQGLVTAAIAGYGRLDILVCNAGITGIPGSMAALDWADYDRVMAINLRSAVALCNIALPHMARQGGGSVILISSISALRGNAAINAYALAKAGLAQLARNLAVQWGPSTIRVNAIAPGLIRTEFSEKLLNNPEFMARRMAMTPLRRPGTPREVAGTAVFLASPAGAFITGQMIVVDGGTLITDGS
jgi:NAD(P)-dependent dehydrogenase (short-subunit alcohol dehydrogenase family)